MGKLCCLCKKGVDAENAPVLTMGGFGNPRYLCDECADNVEQMTTARDVNIIKENIECLSDKMAHAGIDDAATLDAMDALLVDVRWRTEAIKEGKLDFDKEEQALGSEIVGDPEIPEELRETEEDKALDEEELRKKTKFDKIFNWIALGIIALVGGAVAGYYIFNAIVR